jgi:glycerol uptake facilitator-like aquaporin
MVSDDNTYNQSYDSIDNIWSPLIIFIIICFFSLIAIILYKSTTSRIPSIFTIGSLSLLMIFYCAILIVIGTIINPYAAWGCLIILTFLILVTTYSILESEP